VDRRGTAKYHTDCSDWEFPTRGEVQVRIIRVKGDPEGDGLKAVHAAQAVVDGTRSSTTGTMQDTTATGLRQANTSGDKHRSEHAPLFRARGSIDISANITPRGHARGTPHHFHVEHNTTSRMRLAHSRCTTVRTSCALSA
jgi:hypothetical protein